MISKEDAAVISAYTGVLMCEFTDVHEYIEKVMGRPVWTHEMASKEMWAEIREASKPDFMKLLPGNCPETPEGSKEGHDGPA